jgi:signal transduction histidine kinase/ligand-binding sensor domain-containing protein
MHKRTDLQHNTLKIIIPALLFALSLNLKAGEVFRFERIDIYNGLAHNSIQGIMQDSHGFLWIATENGLNRYDGYNFIEYRPEKSNSNSISGIFIWDVKEDHEGNIWIATNNAGLNKFNFYTEEFTHYRHNPLDKNTISDDYVRIMLIDTDSNIWIGTYGGGLNKYNPKTNTFKHYKHVIGDSSTLTNNTISYLYQDKSNTIWVGTEGGLHKYIPERDDFEVYMNDITNEESLSHNQVNSIIEDHKGNLWVGTKDGLNLFNREKGTFKRFKNEGFNENSLSHNLITSFSLDNSNRLWIGTDGGGISILDLDTYNFTRIQHDPSNPFSLSSDLVRHIFQDRQGITWIATNGGGICKLNNQSKKFEHYYNVPNNLNSLSHNVVRSFYDEENGIVWIGTVGGGINIYDRVNDKFHYLKNNEKDPSTISDNMVISLHRDSEGILWAGTWEAGLNRIELKDGFEPGADLNNKIRSLKRYYSGSTGDGSISSDIVQVIFEDNFDNLWIGTGSGLDLYNRKTDEFVNIGNTEMKPELISDNRIQTAIFQDKNNNIWFGSWNGLNQLIYTDELKQGIIPTQKEAYELTIKKYFDSNSGLSDNRIISLCYDTLNTNFTIWAGTYGGGLNRIDVVESETSDSISFDFTVLTVNDGLADNVIYAIHIDESGNLWMSTNNGLSMYNPTNDKFRNYNISEGVQSKQFYWGSSFKNSYGEIYFGGVNGFNLFHPDSIYGQSIIPTVKITDFQIFNKTVPVGDFEGRTILNKTISETEEIVLSHKDYVFSVEYASLHFSAPRLNEYKYMMEGFEKEWHYVGNRRFVTYTNLPPGEYTFIVKGSNNEGVWNEKGAQLRIIIKPPFYKTWLFRLVAVVAIASLIIWIFRMRINAIEKQRRKLEIEVKKRTKELQLEIAERKRAEESLLESQAELKSLNASKDKFFGIIAHDLKNPINISLGFSELLFKNYSLFNDEKKKRYLEAIYKASSNIFNLLENLLQWSLAQTSGIKKQLKKHTIEEIISQNIQLIEEAAKKKDITINIEIDAALQVHIDRNMIDTVFRNLLTNAVKFTDHNGTITIQTSEDTTTVCISVIDTGVGISPEKINDLFAIDKSSSTKGTDGESGTGIGLVLCKDFVEENNGKIEIDSKLNEGTTIRVFLPK